MSTETLADEEREALLVAVCTLGAAERAAYGHEHRHEARMAQLTPVVERILAARERALRDEIARLSRWKEEALPVLDGLQEIGRALGLPLGERITGPAALAAIERLIARGGAR